MKLMKVLHIANGFAGSVVHRNLCEALDELGLTQLVYCPVRDASLINGNRFPGKSIDFVYSLCIKSWYKYVYHYKARKLYNDLCSKVNLGEINLIHAHTLFSDGILAYKAHRSWGLRYVVTVRNTDVNDFIRLLRHTYPMGRKTLQEADKVYFISPALMQAFFKTDFAKPLKDEIEKKCRVLPNGVDEFWLDNLDQGQRDGNDILYIGDFSANKNVVRLCQAIQELRDESILPDLKLVVIGGEKQGGGRTNDGRTRVFIDKHPEMCDAKGYIYDKQNIARIMRNCRMFAMPSIYETFGLVYVEALSQNLPIIYTKGQGVDGLFARSVGVSVNPKSVQEIKEAIMMIWNGRGIYSNSDVNFEQFRWTNISTCYYDDYIEITRIDSKETIL